MSLRPQQVVPELLHKLTKALGITALDQWYYVSQYTAKQVIGSSVLNEFGGSLSSFLQHAYPHHQFDEEKLASRVKQEKDQKFIEVVVRRLFPNIEIITKAKKAVGIINPETDAYLEVDFWIPSLKLGIEYQDKHHYGYQWYANDTLEDYQKRDDIKKDAMSAKGYTLITIGYWWDKSIESLAATIRKHRPELLGQYEHISAELIPANPPLGYSNASPAIPGVAGIMNPFVPKHKFYPTNWLAGEKHDGIRGVYNAKLIKMFSRSGNELSILPTLLKDVPNMLVEGEITAGRGNYSNTAAMSYHTHHDKVNWPLFRYILFDVPDAEAGKYTQRYATIIRKLLVHPYIFSQSAFRVFLASKSHLKVLLDSIISDSGEGVIAQQDTIYEYGRSKGLAKIKVRRDADAQVLHINKLSCTCQLINGVTAEINFGDDFSPQSLVMGDIVSYHHDGYSKSGLPKRGEIYKVRYDQTWEQLVNEAPRKITKRRTVKEATGARSLISQHKERNKMGHWNKPSNVRAFLDEFAQTTGFDSLVPDNWYSVRYTDLHAAGGASLLSTHGFEVKRALSYAYPELKFDRDKFRFRVNKGHWNDKPTVRAFFDEFARINDFDAMVPENWYPVRTKTLQQAGGSGLLRYFSVLNKALLFAYPEVKFKEEGFRTAQTKKVRRGHWRKPENIRPFFDEVARNAGFDPLVPENWYSVTTKAIQQVGGSSILKYYTLTKALMVSYPDLKFEDAGFKTLYNAARKGHWHSRSNIRAFFDELARNSGFDPLVSKNWYKLTATLVRTAGGSGILNHFTIAKAIPYAYPELTFEAAKFKVQKSEPRVRYKKGYWNEPTNVRAFFDEFASTAGFDPLIAENWYHVRKRNVQHTAGGIFNYYTLTGALTTAYPELSLRPKRKPYWKGEHSVQTL